MSKKVKRLIENFRPEHYDLKIEPDAKTKKFKGSVTVKGRVCGRPSQRITFHQVGLKISKATVVKTDKKGESELVVDRINNHDSLQEVRFHTKEKIFPGEYSITMEFSGVITDSMQGIYISNFKHKNKTEPIIATQFESHHARSAFPCIDEPEAKATFTLNLIAPKGLVALSNTNIQSQTEEKDSIVYTFETTPIMSTYLLAFVIGDLKFKKAKTKSGITVRSWASQAQDEDSLDYSVKEAVNILDFFEDYFGVPYPLKKCDQVALPDFDAGAMENWGLITYREVALLADSKNRSVSNEQYVSMVVAHELSHQWFGNLVTMKWWDDLWLNESFASLMEHVALNALHPDWQQWEHYVASDVLATTNRDIYKDVQAVSCDVDHPELIETLFDPGIVYAKGGRLLKMLLDFVGEKDFRKGLNNYFKKFAYKNASREDLWSSLSDVTKIDISKLMTPWLLQSGMPQISVDQVKDKVTLTQNRFMLDGEDNAKIWPVPLLAEGEHKQKILHKKEESFSSDTYPLILNEQASGHYVTFYKNPEQRQAIFEKFKDNSLLAETKMNILNDYYSLSRKGQLSATQGLDILWANIEEKRDNVWALMTRFIGVANLLTEGNEQAHEMLKTLRRTIAKNGYKTLGWKDTDSDDPNTKQLRHTMISLMIGGEDQDAINTAFEIYTTSKSIADIPSELRSSVLIAAIKKNSDAVVKQLIDAYENSSAEVQGDITVALTSVKNPELIKIIFDDMIGPKGKVRAQDLMRWLAFGVRNYYTREYVWGYIKQHWKWVESTLNKSKSFDFLPVYIAGAGSSQEWLEDFENFFEDKKHIKTLQQNIKVGISDIKAKVEWRKRDQDQILDWLSHHI